MFYTHLGTNSLRGENQLELSIDNSIHELAGNIGADFKGAETEVVEKSRNDTIAEDNRKIILATILIKYL